METKMIRVHFDVELAKKITKGEVKGKIVTRNGKNVRIVCFDRKSELNKFPILALIENEKVETSYIFNSKGYTNFYGLETSSDLFLEIPEYMTFNDGDIATLGWKSDDGEFCEWITILKSVEADEINILTEDYVTVCLKCDEENYFPIDFDCTSDGAKWIRKPTEPEKQELIEALKESKEPKAKECLKMLGIEQKKEYKFKPFDKVLVRNSLEMDWIPRFFERATQCSQSVRYITLDNNSWKYCIPYNEQTAHLLGTTDNWEE